MRVEPELQLGSRAAGGADSARHFLLSAPSLENRILAQASSILPHAPSHSAPSWAKESTSPSLRPSQLSSTSTSLPLSSSLLSSSIQSSPLLHTQNRLLQMALLPPPATLAPPAALLGPPAALLGPPAALLGPPAALLGPPRSQPPTGEKLQGGLLDSEHLPSPSQAWSQVSEQSSWADQDPDVVSSEMPVPDLHVDEAEDEVSLMQDEEFDEVEKRSDEEEEALKDKKYLLLNAVCSSLVGKLTPPGQDGWDQQDSQWTRVKNLVQDVSLRDPEFILKVAVYTRQDLNIRITANFLLALAAHLPATRPHLRRYFCAAVQLPSDWLEVARLYSQCFGCSLPSCLKKSLTEKFRHFSEYQLAKYNTRKQRCKHNHTRAKKQKPTPLQWGKWASILRSDPDILQKYLKAQQHSVVQKRADVFSLKKMVQRLHIRQPAEHVMAILQKRYPVDVQAFGRSGLSGAWQRERAGQRMKLAQPDTWERQLSQQGNHAHTWEGLIDRKSLPFMAMLRNLRSMIMQGISEKHHQQVLARLTNRDSVIRSRQFPFRFLSAYKVILELGNLVKEVPSSKETLQRVLQRLPRQKRYHSLDWQTVGRKRLRVALGVPFISRIFNMKRRQQQKASHRPFSAELLGRYQQALERAIQISCRYNVPPLAGRTLVLCDVTMTEDLPFSNGLDFCCPPDPDAQSEDTSESSSLTPTVQEVAVLLGLMIAYCSEHAQLVLYDYCICKEVELKPDNLLDNVRHVMKQIKNFRRSDDNTDGLSQFFADLSSQTTKVNTVVCLGDRDWNSLPDWHIDTYRRNTNTDTLVVNVHLNTRQPGIVNSLNTDRNCVEVHGFSEQILRFVAERGSFRLLDHVEHMDKLHGIPPPDGAKDQNGSVPVACPLPAAPKLRWRAVRVFVSSTFRDMHGERDVLVRSVFPELRRRAAPHCLYLQEVELRWGVTEEEAGRALQLCLSEVCRSQLLLGILGERYGMVPPRPTLPDLPQYQWLSSAPPELSITEMEIRQFQALHPDSAQSRMFFYFRSPHVVRSVPVAWRVDFASESQEAESKMADLRSRILRSGVKVTKDYPCEWGGVDDGKPYVKGLEAFGKAVLEDLWGALLRLYVEEAESTEAESEVTEQEVYQDAQQRQCHGRDKLVSAATAAVHDCQRRGGGQLLVQGGPGEGKTVFMAALAHALRNPDKSQKTPGCDVISYFTAASQTARRVEQLLRYLIRCLWRRVGKEEEPLPTAYQDLLAEFHTQLRTLSEVRKNESLALLIDGVELVQDARGQPSSDWIPKHFPPGVSVVLSVSSSSALQQTLAKMKGSTVFPLGLLSLPDRKEIVQRELAAYGKKLSDSAFNNQIQTLIMKKGAVSPLYLRLACKELRSFAIFEKMKDSLQSLPASLGQLVELGLRRLQSQHRGLHWAMAALTASHTGLRERDLYALLSMCSQLSSGSGMVTWQDMLQLARTPQKRIPMATFGQLLQSLQSLIGQNYSQGPDDRLTLTNPEVRLAFKQLFLSGEADKTRAHHLLAAYLWALSDPQGKDTFLHCETDAVLHLPSHLMGSGQWEALSFLLSSFHFLYANVRHGLLHHLLETYSLFEKSQNLSSTATADAGRLGECRSFLQRYASLLSHWPALFVQQALNEPEGGAAHAWAQGIVGKGGSGGVCVMRWLNKPEQVQTEASERVSTFHSKPTCVAVSPGGGVTVVGTGRGWLHLLHSETGQEVRSLVSSCDGISGCVFLGESLVASTSFDGQLEVWDTESGCRTTHVDAHSNRITGSDVSRDRKYLATVSLDFSLKLWLSPDCSPVATLPHPCPLNCVTFHSEGQLLAVGGWDGGIRLWNCVRMERVATLAGHPQSVRSLLFCPSGLLTSGCLSGEVRLWSVPAQACVGRYDAHQGSAELLSFIEGGDLLMTAGSDSVVQLWSGGLGQAVALLGRDEKPTAGNPALCVAVAEGYAAVGYHGDGLMLYSVESGERRWVSENLRVSVQCLIWIPTVTLSGAETGAVRGAGLLVSGGGDQRLRVWRMQKEGMELKGSFGVQQGPILALALSSSLLASASEDFTIALWSLQDFTSDPCGDPSLISLLRGHSGGVTCLSFSPSGEELLSGGKDRALLVWRVQPSPPSLSQSLLHCHRDWVTGCVWTTHTVVSCSTDGMVCVWDLATGCCVREILSSTPLSSVCSVGKHVMAGTGGGELLVWEWQSGVQITRIPAHHAPVQHCSILPHTGVEESQEVRQKDVMVVTASDDGTVKLWRPFEVHHHSTLPGHSGGIQGLAVREKGVPAFLTVSEDCSLRSWSLDQAMESPPGQRGAVRALCYFPCGQVVVSGTDCGRMEVWRGNSVVCWQQVSGGAVTALACMPEGQFAVGCRDCSVSVWRLDWNLQQTTAQLCKVSSYTLKSPVKFLLFCSILLGVCEDETILDVTLDEDDSARISWREHSVRTLSLKPNDEKSTWLLGEEKEGRMELAFAFALGPGSELSRSFSSSSLDMRETNENPERKHKKAWISAAAIDREFVVCGDSMGNMWFNQPPNLSTWSSKKPAHAGWVSVLRITDDTIISASHDRSVKLWDRQTKKQVGMFSCAAPVVSLEVNPCRPSELVCGDTLGGIYFLTWRS
ncbi:telomerase protein component 1 [Megalops cyprinoides]|uniref:telomerase protein component 1 n=1 Tax=Megalops cyprinoides TaxID=118141 RepID=UPI0018643AA1|nr:telomerase protein component 1 [Megalops cyprinoides]